MGRGRGPCPTNLTTIYENEAASKAITNNEHKLRSQIMNHSEFRDDGPASTVYEERSIVRQLSQAV